MSREWLVRLAVGVWRRRPDSNRRIEVLQTFALATWPRLKLQVNTHDLPNNSLYYPNMIYDLSLTITDNHLAMYWETYKQAKLSEGKQPYTLDKYLICLRKFNDWLFTHDATPDKTLVQQFLVSLQTKGLSPYRVRNYWVALMSFYTWAEEQEYMPNNPMKGVKAPKLPKGTIEVYTDHEVDSILNMATNSSTETIITTFWKTGIRGSELLQIKNSDINMNTQTMHIHGKGSKDRTVPFDNNCAQLLDPLLSTNGTEYTFPTTLTQIRKSLKFYCENCGVDYRGPHCFRHTFACNYLKAGGSPLDLMYILGHSTLAMVNHYSQWLASDRAIENYHKLYATAF
jgi:integrase